MPSCSEKEQHVVSCVQAGGLLFFCVPSSPLLMPLGATSRAISTSRFMGYRTSFSPFTVLFCQAQASNNSSGSNNGKNCLPTDSVTINSRGDSCRSLRYRIHTCKYSGHACCMTTILVSLHFSLSVLYNFSFKFPTRPLAHKTKDKTLPGPCNAPQN